MKQKVLLSLFFLCTFIVTTRAQQISKGSVWLGGNIGFNQNKTDYDNNPDYKNQSFSISPTIGKAVQDNLIVGINITYQKTKTTNIGGAVNESNEKYYGGGVFVRRYVPVISRLYVFGDVNVWARRYRSDGIPYAGATIKTQTKGGESGVSLTPGISVGINKKLQLETGFNSLFSTYYSKRKTTSSTNGYNYTNETFGAGFNLENKSTFYIGFRLLINNKA
jgi:hypothetical protein